MKKSAELYKVVNAIINALRQGDSIAYVGVTGNTSKSGSFTPEDDFRELRLELLSYNSADDDEDVAPEGFCKEHNGCDIWTLFRGNDFITLAIDSEYYVDSYELRDMISDDYELEAAEITTGMNGYPRGLRGCVLLDDKEASSYDAIERMAELYGVEVVSLRRKDGWQLWESQGWASELYDFEDYMNSHDDNLITFGSFKEYADHLREVASDEMLEDMTGHALIEKAKELENGTLKDNQFITVSTYDLSRYEIAERKVTHFYYDTWNFCLALDCMVAE